MKNLKKHTEVDNSELEALLEEDITRRCNSDYLKS